MLKPQLKRKKAVEWVCAQRTSKEVVKKSLPEIRIGLNESHIRKCSSKQVQLPEAMFQEGNERVVCSGLFFCN